MEKQVTGSSYPGSKLKSAIIAAGGWDTLQGILIFARHMGKSTTCKAWVYHQQMSTLIRSGARVVHQQETVTEVVYDGIIFTHACHPIICAGGEPF